MTINTETSAKFGNFAIIASVADDDTVNPASSDHPIPVTIDGTIELGDINITEIGGAPISLGQKDMAHSLPVVIASDQSPVPVSGTVTAANASVGLTGATAPTSATEIGAVFNTTQPTVTNGQMVAAQATARGAQIVAPGVDNFPVQATLAAETTKVIGTVNQGTSPWVVAGGKTNNNAAPGANNTGALIAIANAAKPSWTEGFEVLNSVDLSGNQRTRINDAAGNDRGMNVTSANAGLVDLSASTANATAGLISVKIDQTTDGTTNKVSATQATASNLNAQVVGAVASAAANAGNPVKTAAVFNTTQPTVTNSQIVDIQATARGAQIVATGVDGFPVTVAAGSAIIGNVRIDQTTPGTTNGVAIAQIGSTTVSSDNGASGAGVIRVTLANNSTGNIATIGTSVTPGTAAANLGKAEDAAHTTGDTGVMGLGVRNDANAALTTTDLDYSAHAVDSAGRTVVMPHSTRASIGSQVTTITASTSATTIVTADASFMNDLVSITLTNISATGTEVQILDDDGTTVRWEGYAPPTDMRGIVFPVVLKQTAVNKTWKAITVTSITSLKITAQFVKNV